ncbi:hypothetical protein NMG60_11034141 [Bertholletia excelsa]
MSMVPHNYGVRPNSIGQLDGDENSAIVSACVDWRETSQAMCSRPTCQISGERHAETEEKNDTWHRAERSSGKLVRWFRLPENAKMDQVKASMEHGVLTVTVPKEEVKKPDVKVVQISG